MDYREVLEKISVDYGKARAQEFREFLPVLFADQKTESPIEQVMVAALYAQAELSYIVLEDIIGPDEKPERIGLEIMGQHQIGRYRVDFLCVYHFLGDALPQRKVVIECDGQAFHERTHEERSYEKRRDRFLQSKGFKVLRFTGRDILRDPMKCAEEVIAFILPPVTTPPGEGPWRG